MPNYHSEDALYFGRETRKNSKVHRNRRVLVGPNIISKYVWYRDSHTSVFNFIDDDGKLKKFYEKEPNRSLAILDGYAVDRYNVPYSSNKHKLWRLIDDAYESLQDVQNPDLHSRVSLLRVRTHCLQSEYDYPGWRTDITYEEDIVLEFHGLNGDEEVDISEPYISFEETYRNIWNPKEREDRRQMKKRKIFHSRLRVITEKERLDADIPRNERATHIFVKEQVMFYSPGMINSGSRKYRPVEIRRSHTQKRRTKRKRRPHRLCRLKRKHLLIPVEDLVFNVEQEPSSIEQDLHAETSWQEPLLSDVCPLKSFVVQRKQKRKRKCFSKHAVKWTAEYEQWYKSKPKLSDTEKLQLNMASATLDTYEALPQLLVPFEDDSYTVVGKLLTHAHRIDGIQPATFILDLSSAVDIDLPEFLLSFTGFVIIQPVTEEESIPHPSIRIILNATVQETERCEGYQKTRRKKPVLLFDGVFSEGCSIQEAESIALQRAYGRNKHQVSTASLTKTSSFLCSVCGNFDNDGFALDCGHYNCRSCWSLHAIFKMDIASVPITCPEMKCNLVVSDEQMLAFLPVTTCQRYRTLLCNKEFMKPEWIHCASCSQIILCFPTPSASCSIATCVCGEYMCRVCKDRAHVPLACDEARFYFSILGNNGRVLVDDKNPSVRVKKCFACGNFCEKLDGCNHMTCLCGEEFCYVCGEKWKSYRAHEKCMNDVSVEVELIDVPKGVLNHVPLKVFEECMKYRQNRRGKQLHQFRTNLSRIFRSESVEIERIVELYLTGNQILELSTMKIALLRRSARQALNVNAGLVQAGHLYAGCSVLRFHMTRLKSILELSGTRPGQIILQSRNIEQLLQRIVSQFSPY